MCVRSALRNFLMPGIDNLMTKVQGHFDAASKFGDIADNAPQMPAGHMAKFSHLPGLKEIR